MCSTAFDHLGLKSSDHVIVDPAFYRPAEVDVLLGDASKAKAKLGWQAETSLEDMIIEMVDADMARLRLQAS